MFNKDPRGSRFLIDVKEKSMARWQHNYFDKISRDNCKNLYIYLYIYLYLPFSFYFPRNGINRDRCDVPLLMWKWSGHKSNDMSIEQKYNTCNNHWIRFNRIFDYPFFLFCRIQKRTIDERWRGSRQIIISLVEFQNDGYDHWKFIYMIDYRI